MTHRTDNPDATLIGCIVKEIAGQKVEISAWSDGYFTAQPKKKVFKSTQMSYLVRDLREYFSKAKATKRVRPEIAFTYVSDRTGRHVQTTFRGANLRDGEWMFEPAVPIRVSTVRVLHPTASRVRLDALAGALKRAREDLEKFISENSTEIKVPHVSRFLDTHEKIKREQKVAEQFRAAANQTTSRGGGK